VKFGVFLMPQHPRSDDPVRRFREYVATIAVRAAAEKRASIASLSKHSRKGCRPRSLESFT